MKATIKINVYEHLLSNEKLIDILSYIGDCQTEAEVSVWNFSKQFSGYGHYKTFLDLEINERKLIINKTTNNMSAIDSLNDDDESIVEETIAQFIEEIINANEHTICDFIDEIIESE